MSKRLKFLIGLAAALLAGVISHWPLGRGEAFLGQIEAPLQPLLERARIPGLAGHVQREPLARTAVLSGPADCFQRTGVFKSGKATDVPGLDQQVLAIPGMGRVEWTNPPPEGECR
jgi:OOP family OmpA-OmpF porin